MGGQRRQRGEGVRRGQEVAQGFRRAAKAPVRQQAERVAAARQMDGRPGRGAPGMGGGAGARGGEGARGDGTQDADGALVAAGDAVEGFDPDAGEEVLEEGDGTEDAGEMEIERHRQRERGVDLGLLLGGVVGLGHVGKIAQREMGGKRNVRFTESRMITPGWRAAHGQHVAGTIAPGAVAPQVGWAEPGRPLSF